MSLTLLFRTPDWAKEVLEARTYLTRLRTAVLIWNVTIVVVLLLYSFIVGRL
jgi:hypothetical protein